MSKTRIVAMFLIGAALALAAPVGAHPGHYQATRCDKHHPLDCRKAVQHLRRAIAWQKAERHKAVARVLDHVRGTQPFAYSAKLAYAACVTFSSQPADCRPASEMISVGRCESGLQIHDPNPTSTADGWMQYLSGTWASQRVAQLGFSLYDPIAVAVATEGMARSGWGAWAASGYCHHLS